MTRTCPRMPPPSRSSGRSFDPPPHGPGQPGAVGSQPSPAGPDEPLSDRGGGRRGAGCLGQLGLQAHGPVGWRPAREAPVAVPRAGPHDAADASSQRIAATRPRGRRRRSTPTTLSPSQLAPRLASRGSPNPDSQGATAQSSRRYRQVPQPSPLDHPRICREEGLMASDNQTVIVGNLVDDPELRFTNNGTPDPTSEWP